MAQLATRCGTVFIIDDDMESKIIRYSWFLDKDGYVARKTTVDGKKGVCIRLHRFVAGAKNCETIDHKNHNKLDNRLINLRLADKSQNAMNMKKKSGTSSMYKGVTWNKHRKKWQATIKANGRNFYIGLFGSEHEAGHAYNKAAIKLHGEFASLNPVGEYA